MKRTLFIALCLYLFDVTVVNYWIAIPAIFIVLGGIIVTSIKYAVTIFKKEIEVPIRRIWIRHAIYFLMVVLIISTNVIDSKIAKSRASVIIKSCEEYKLEHGEYPEKLTDLTPVYMHEIPSPKPITIPGLYAYIYHRRYVVINGQRDTDYNLGFIQVLPHELELYDSQKHEWKSLG